MDVAEATDTNEQYGNGHYSFLYGNKDRYLMFDDPSGDSVKLLDEITDIELDENLSYQESSAIILEQKGDLIGPCLEHFYDGVPTYEKENKKEYDKWFKSEVKVISDNVYDEKELEGLNEEIIRYLFTADCFNSCVKNYKDAETKSNTIKEDYLWIDIEKGSLAMYFDNKNGCLFDNKELQTKLDNLVEQYYAPGNHSFELTYEINSVRGVEYSIDFSALGHLHNVDDIMENVEVRFQYSDLVFSFECDLNQYLMDIIGNERIEIRK